ncbi:MAG TPA: S4 domain-containing protein [Gammaproteobacteria bacterium]|nr:S4 domain-containing protein [Gammaproteobacteria bacterium]
MPERIQKVLANAGIGSRRSIERWVAEGRITVDGRVAKLGQQLQGRERVCLDGKPVRLTAAVLARPRHDFLAYYKAGPTRGAPEAEAAPALPRPRQGRWIDVSPMDRNTSGLVVLTTDGDLAAKLTHPSVTVEREYAVRLLGEPSEAQLQQLRDGIELDGGTAAFATIEGGGASGSNAWYRVTLRDTRHRDLRPALAAVGLAVSRVIRVRYHTVELGELYRGASRPLTPAETRALYAVAGLEGRGGAERTKEKGQP